MACLLLKTFSHPGNIDLPLFKLVLCLLFRFQTIAIVFLTLHMLMTENVGIVVISGGVPLRVSQ